MTHYFFSGIGGSGMLPLAQILKGQGHRVSGSDRARDQGRSPEKFASLESEGFTLFPQDGSGLYGTEAPAMSSPVCMLDEFENRPDMLVISTAVEDDVPDVAAAKHLGIPVIKRAALLAELFNGFPRRIAVGGTSGKTTTTGMIAFILHYAGLDPVVMNGGILKNFGTSALVGKGDVFVTEADESDGSIAAYRPDIAVLNNISIDHKSMDELRVLFRDFTARATHAIINADNAEALALAGANATTFGLASGTYTATDVFHMDEGISAVITNGHARAALSLEMIGDHNLSNALAAIAAVAPYGVSLRDACEALNRFQGIKRRMEYVGEANGITVYDDFAHNPDKITASLNALKKSEGRLLVIFQMHGYGPLKLMWRELAAAFADNLAPTDHVFMPPPLYMGGTADRTIGTELVTDTIGPRASWHETREAAGQAALSMARAGDRIIVMGARDDTLSAFARSLLQK